MDCKQKSGRVEFIFSGKEEEAGSRDIKLMETCIHAQKGSLEKKAKIFETCLQYD